MTIYLQSVDFNIWDVVIKGPYVPLRNDNGSVFEKTVEEWDKQDRKLCSKNAKAMTILYCGLNSDDLNRI